MRTILAILVTAILAGCSSAPRVMPISDTPWPQTVVNAPKDEVRDRFAAAVASTGAAIERTDDSIIEMRIPDANAAMAKAFFGCPACADPYLKATAVFSQLPEGTQVVVQYWRMIPKYNGSETRMEVDQVQDYNQWQQALWNLRDQYAEN